MPGPVQQGGQLPLPDCLPAGVQQGQRGEDAERAQGDDERRQLEPGDQQPLSSPQQGADGKPMSRARKPGTPLFAARLAMTSMDRMHDGADGQVDAGGEDDQGLTDRQGGDDGDLLEDERDVAGLREPRVDDREDDERDDQHQQRADRRDGECSTCWIRWTGDWRRCANCSAALAGACGIDVVVTWASFAVAATAASSVDAFESRRTGTAGSARR